MRKIFLIAALFLLPNVGFAETECSSKACTGVIKSFYLRDAEFIHVRLDPVYKVGKEISNLNCALQGDKYFTVLHTHKNYREVYSALLSAKATQSDVTLRIVEGSVGCEINYIVAY